MAGSSAQYHEDNLSEETKERHRAIVSLMEELEAIDWYDQRINVTQDEGLRQILIHNRDEEKEHAALAVEWLRRRDPVWDQQLREKLFTSTPFDVLAAAEEGGGGAAEAAPAPRPSDGSLGIGSLRETPTLQVREP